MQRTALALAAALILLQTTAPVHAAAKPAAKQAQASAAGTQVWGATAGPYHFLRTGLPKDP